jgi:hypothetical protein
VPIEDLNVYLGHEFDSVKSKSHRSINAIRQSLSGRSNGPQTLIANSLDSTRDTIFRRLALIPHSPANRLWIPEASLDLWPDLLWKSLDRKSVALGPSVDIFNSSVLTRLKHSEYIKILVPSQWVKELFVNHHGLSESRVFVWPAGIDHEYWNPTAPSNSRYLILYRKTELAERELSNVKEFAKRVDLELKIISYGDYKIKQFRDLLRHSQGLVWAGSTESQGLAQFESWAMNVPTLIRRARNFENLGIGSESPYLTNQTGLSTREDHIAAVDLEIFSDMMPTFQPRDWILQNATLEIARSHLLSIFEAE